MSTKSKLRIKLPLERRPFSGSTDSWIADANGDDIARPSPYTYGTVVAFHDATAELIVESVNAHAYAYSYRPVYITKRSLDGTEWSMTTAQTLQHKPKLCTGVDGEPMILVAAYAAPSPDDAKAQHMKLMASWHDQNDS